VLFKGRLKDNIGEIGNIEAETQAILSENGIDSNEFDDELIQTDLPSLPWTIPTHEYTYRRDLRDMCIFTIDPATARDLDDALHCTRIDENLYEVGVHIADVSHFIPEDTYIDRMASQRTTSVYLVQKVIPMLPRTLCENLCSLNPNEERLTFSVIWRLNANGDILSEWFGRTIIKSCVKLSYEHAQIVIDGLDKNDEQKFPAISERFSLEDVKDSVLNLYEISKNLRARRYANGCLTLSQIKVCFLLNKSNKMPFAYDVYEQKDSNRYD
jgi:DIS3-like exonuclease 2